jgi:transposase
MPQNFIECGHEQVFLLPPDVREWLPEGHLAWFVRAAVEEMDLSAFYGAYRADGHGRAAYEPSMMVALLLYGYARGVRSSRAIERACEEDVAYRVLATNQKPDHATLARFVERHEEALAGLFSEVLGLCAEAGLVKAQLIAIDGTKVAANASRDADRDYEQIAREILEQAKAVDQAEDERFGEARGDELPPHLSTHGGRRAWLRDAKRRHKERRAREARRVPRSRAKRLAEAKRRLEEDLEVEDRANAAYEAYRARGVAADGSRRMAPGATKPYEPPDAPAGKVNLTDPDSRLVKAMRGWIQGYNAQAAVSEEQIVLAAEVTIDSPDFGHLEPMVEATEAELVRAGVPEKPEVALADAGYWHQKQMESVVGRGTQVLIPPDSKKRDGARPGWKGGYYAFMRRVLATERGGGLYRKRQAMIEPVFGNTKFNRGFDRFRRRGRSAARCEWRLITATHNLLKLHQHKIAAAGA